jgi:hypothetical protein
MATFHERCITGEYAQVWDELCLLGPVVPLMFEDAPLQMEGRDLTLVRNLRYALRGGGFLAFLPGSTWKPRPDDDLAHLTEGLLPV